MNENELQAVLGFILNKLPNINPNLSKLLTKEANKRKGLETTLERKKFKVLLLIEKHRSVFDEIAVLMNKEFSTPANPLGYSSSDFFTSVYYWVKQVAGSYESKYDYTQGPIG